MWTAFEESLKLAYSIEETPKKTRKEFEDWVEAPKERLRVLEVFMNFERRFKRWSAWDQTILVPDKVAIFLQVVDI